MVRKNRRRNRRQNKSFNRADSIMAHVRLYTEASFSSGGATIAINPASFPQAAQIADTYAMYRVVKLRYRLHRTTTTSSTQVAVYVPGVTDNPPLTVSVAALVAHAAILPLTATVPTPWKNVPSNVLKSYMPWFKTILGSPDPAEETQGNIFLRGITSDQYGIEIDAIFAFREPISTSVTPMERGKIECAREKERILRVLGTLAPTPAPATTVTGGVVTRP